LKYPIIPPIGCEKFGIKDTSEKMPMPNFCFSYILQMSEALTIFFSSPTILWEKWENFERRKDEAETCDLYLCLHTLKCTTNNVFLGGSLLQLENSDFTDNQKHIIQKKIGQQVRDLFKLY
jgi:hypothetical protein